MSNYMQLVSGSDLRGVAIDIGAGITLSPDVCAMAAAAFARQLKHALGKASLRLAIGHDSRLSAQALHQGVMQGLFSEQVTVVDLGLCTTPAMFMAVLELGLDASIMITASHLPFERNGLKFITKEGGLSSSQVRQIAGDMRPIEYTLGQVETLDYLPRYAQGLVDYIRAETGKERPLLGKNIVVDAGNGAGGFFASLVLEPLGACTDGSVFLQPDGHFPNHSPNPEDAAAMQAICKATLAKGADLGVIFDADCDRAAIVDRAGTPINRNRLIALLAAVELEKRPGGTIVTDSVTSLGLGRFIEKRGGVHRRYMRGYKNVIDEAKRLNAQGTPCPIAIETSGHCAFKDNHFLDDGAYMVCRILAGLDAGDPMALIRDLDEPAEELEIRLRLTNADFRPDGERAILAMQRAILENANWRGDTDFEGVRALVSLPDGGEGFILLRLSLHDPVLPINIESSSKGGVQSMLGQLRAALAGLPGIDLSPLQSE